MLQFLKGWKTYILQFGALGFGLLETLNLTNFITDVNLATMIMSIIAAVSIYLRSITNTAAGVVVSMNKLQKGPTAS